MVLVVHEKRPPGNLALALSNTPQDAPGAQQGDPTELGDPTEEDLKMHLQRLLTSHPSACE
jgi:hypothetical protein